MVDGYEEVRHTPGLFKHNTQKICFTLVADNLGIKCSNKNDIEHLIQTLKKHYEAKIYWDGALYCGITLKWDYEKQHVDLSIPNCVYNVIER